MGELGVSKHCHSGQLVPKPFLGEGAEGLTASTRFSKGPMPPAAEHPMGGPEVPLASQSVLLSSQAACGHYSFISLKM